MTLKFTWRDQEVEGSDRKIVYVWYANAKKEDRLSLQKFDRGLLVIWSKTQAYSAPQGKRKLVNDHWLLQIQGHETELAALDEQTIWDVFHMHYAGKT
jgi:hypothetical protein